MCPAGALHRGPGPRPGAPPAHPLRAAGLQRIGENGETLLFDATGGGAAFTERGFAGVMAMRAVGDVSHYGAAPAVNVYQLVADGGLDDLPDNPTPDVAVTGATGALQFDLGELGPGQDAWVAVTFVHHGDPFAGAEALGLADAWIAGRDAQALVEDELALWADFQASLTMPAGQSAEEEILTRQSAAMLRMGQVREGEYYLREWLSQDGDVRRTRFPATLPGTVQHLGRGAILTPPRPVAARPAPARPSLARAPAPSWAAARALARAG